MGFLDNIKNKLFNHEPGSQDFLTDDERELREYEEHYTPQSGIAEGVHSEFVVSDVLSVTGKGTVAIGTVTSGVFNIGDKLTIICGHEKELSTILLSIEQFNRLCSTVAEGANAGFLLKDIDRRQISRNDIIKKA